MVKLILQFYIFKTIMKKNRTLVLFVLSTAIVLTACGLESAPAVKNDIKPPVSTQLKTESKEPVNDLKLLQGRWQDFQDKNSEVVFQDDQRIDYYEGKEVDKGIFSVSSTCEGASAADQPSDYILQGDLCWEIASLDEEILSVIYVGRGNAIFYSRVTENGESGKENQVSSEDQKTDDDEKVADVDSPLIDAKITTPVTVTGRAPAFWFFENSFPVQVQDSSGTVLGYGQANPITESMPEGMTEFHAEIEFEKPATSSGLLLLRADNPSGLPENDYSVEIPVTF